MDELDELAFEEGYKRASSLGKAGRSLEEGHTRPRDAILLAADEAEEVLPLLHRILAQVLSGGTTMTEVI